MYSRPFSPRRGGLFYTYCTFLLYVINIGMVPFHRGRKRIMLWYISFCNNINNYKLYNYDNYCANMLYKVKKCAILIEWKIMKLKESL